MRHHRWYDYMCAVETGLIAWTLVAIFVGWTLLPGLLLA